MWQLGCPPRLLEMAHCLLSTRAWMCLEPAPGVTQLKAVTHLGKGEHLRDMETSSAHLPLRVMLEQVCGNL